MALMVFIGFWLAGPGPVRVDRAALGCNSSLFSMDVVFLFISFWLAGPGPARVDCTSLLAWASPDRCQLPGFLEFWSPAYLR